MRLPRFSELPVRPGAPPGSSWGVFGEADDLGTLNLMGPAEVRNAAALVRRGAVFALNWKVDGADPPFFDRAPPRHTLFQKYGTTVVDDYLDGFYPQSSTQWDGLRHWGDPGHGFYDGVTLEEVIRDGPGRLGIEHWARRGIAGRGVLLDVARLLEREGAAPDPLGFFPIGADLLERTARAQGVEFRRGDILLVRTGWLEAYQRLDADGRRALAATGRPGSPGLFGEEIPAFLWDGRVAAVAADNPVVEALRPDGPSELPLHLALIARLGMPLGELWRLGPLAEDCAHDGVYEMLVTSAPLDVPGGSGSPANAVALK